MYNHLTPFTYITGLLLILQLSAFCSVHGATWQTLSGAAPLVIARGGFSGLFPDSSQIAYQLAKDSSLPNVVMWCDVQLTKDKAGICFPYLNLDNSSAIGFIFKDRKKTYPVNGNSLAGWFSVDFTLDELANVSLTQGIYSRTPKFDNSFPILTVQDLVTSIKPSGLWLNFEHDLFFQQHNLSARSYVLNISKIVAVAYISSPEVNFLSSIVASYKASKTKLIFRFLGQADTEPSTNQTYGALLKNLTYVKTFASGIIVPKTYIWPVDQQYLLPHTSLVSDAHKVGLEVFASEFANDGSLPYNFSYDPIAEYVSFVDDGDFSVDGLLSGFPITPSEAIGCFSHIGNNSGQAKPLVISNNGASGDYPGCTDLSYAQAISDGADIIDCPVQITKDGIPICLSSINLIDSTNVVQSPFSNLTATIPELNGITGIFTFRLTWSQIQTLTPIIASPHSEYNLFRNPKYRTAGNLVKLSDFLTLAKNSSAGVLIKIENAAYLAEKGFGVIDAVTEALGNASYPSTKRVLIQSTNSSVLAKFKGNNSYEIVYLVDEYIRGALNSSVEDIKKFADSVVVRKASVYPDNQAFLTGTTDTDTVAKFKSFNLPVYVQLFSNEFITQAWDFFSDPTVEINSFVQGADIDGVVTDFPRTAATYKKNLCLGLGTKTPAYMSPVNPGLMKVISLVALPPAEAPYPLLTVDDVNEPPIPAVEIQTPPSPVPPTSSPNAQPKIASCLSLSILAMLLATLSLF